MNEPLSSIIICNYNYAEFLGSCIESALAQSYKNVEVIVIDDGSTAISQKNGGQASAFNAGGQEAHGEIVSLLDSDDMFYPDKVAKVVDTFVANPAIDWCFHSLYMPPPADITDHYLEAHGGLASGFNDLRSTVSRGRFPYLMPPTSGMSFTNARVHKDHGRQLPKNVGGSHGYGMVSPGKPRFAAHPRQQPVHSQTRQGADRSSRRMDGIGADTNHALR